MMSKTILARVSDELYELIQERISKTRRSMSKEIATLIEVGIGRNPNPIHHALEPVLHEMSELKYAVKSFQGTYEMTLGLASRIDKIAEWSKLSIKSLSNIEDYLEKHSRSL
jgi:hypothetical protein